MQSALSSDGASRVRRGGALLGLSLAVLLICQVLTAVAIGLGATRYDRSPGALLAPALLLIASMVVLVGVLRGPNRRRPARWTSRAAMVALPGGVAAGLSIGSVFGSGIPQVVAVGAGLPIVVIALAAVASRVMRGLPAADACTLGIEFVTTLRRADRVGAPRWTIPDEVTVTGAEIVVVARSGRFGAAQFTIPLAEVTEACVHAAPTKRGPWLSLPDGTDLLIPPGDVVVILHRTDTRVLPVFDPQELVEAIDARRHGNCRRADHSAV